MPGLFWFKVDCYPGWDGTSAARALATSAPPNLIGRAGNSVMAREVITLASRAKINSSITLQLVNSRLVDTRNASEVVI